MSKITEHQLIGLLGGVDYYVFPGTTTTVCCITLKTGFTLIGSSACVDPAEFDAQIGRDMAYRDAFQKLWSHEAYYQMQVAG